jgi:hypothetical protein
MKISQSFIKNAVEYFSGDLCGNIMRERWVKGRLLEMDSKAMHLGSYFEYQFTMLMLGVGSVPKNGQIPMPVTTKAGEKTADYKRADANALRLQGYFERMGLKILSAGKKLTKGKFEGTIDLICECQKEVVFGSFDLVWRVGDIIVIDLKYSGLIDNAWEPMGWGAMTRAGSNAQKDHHGIQAKQYHFITGFPFYYLIMAPSNEEDILLLHVPVSEEMLDDHVKGGNALLEKFEFEAQMGFEARPEFTRCNACPLKGECKDKHTFPHPVTVEL